MEMSKSSPRKASEHDENFQRHAVELWRKSGKSRKTVAAELGIGQWTLRDWARKVERADKPIVPQSREALETENERLKREVTELREQRDILKKTLGILSKP